MVFLQISRTWSGTHGSNFQYSPALWVISLDWYLAAIAGTKLRNYLFFYKFLKILFVIFHILEKNRHSSISIHFIQNEDFGIFETLSTHFWLTGFQPNSPSLGHSFHSFLPCLQSNSKPPILFLTIEKSYPSEFRLGKFIPNHRSNVGFVWRSIFKWLLSLGAEIISNI